MSEVTQPDSIWSMRLHDTLSFETAQGIVAVLRVAPGWVYTWRGTNSRTEQREPSGLSGECVAS
jgi:hypothetical protein